MREKNICVYPKNAYLKKLIKTKGCSESIGSVDSAHEEIKKDVIETSVMKVLC